ncbi:MAG: hypothetical protein H7242_20470, partial [Microbacteriaceae bacterium]|nr:hypothetical protein [Burkholderiaceae bacterium]
MMQLNHAGQNASPASTSRCRLPHWRAFLLAALCSASGAHAASVDLYIDNRSDKGTYAADELEVHTVVVGNRGPGAASNAVFSLDVPNTRNSSQPWNTTVVCSASGGATCPASYSLLASNASTLQGSIPSLPIGGAVTLTIRAPGNPASYLYGAQNVQATVVAGAGDTDVSPASNTSNTWIYIPPPVSSYGTSVTGPANVAAPGSTAVNYTVVVSNLGDNNSIFTTLLLNQGQGSGTASGLPYLANARITSIACTGTTGGASCGNVRALNASGALQNPQPAGLVDGTGNQQNIGVQAMPAGSSVTLTVTVNTGISQCSDDVNGNTQARSLVLQSALNPMNSYGGVLENVGNPGDDVAAQTTAVGTFACFKGDLLVNSIVQSPSIAPIGPNAAFSYTATYSNSVASPDAATNVPLSFTALWPIGGSVMNASASCVASGGAVCPAAYSVPNGNTVNAIAPSMPTNSQLQITFSGTSGGNTTQLCQPQVQLAQATIQPPAGTYADTNYNPASIPSFTTGTPTQGNNAYQTQTQANIGVACGASYDLSTEKSGPFSDYAATIPITVVAPGQYIYFRHKVKLLAPSDALVDYVIGDSLQYYTNAGRTAGGGGSPSSRGMSYETFGSPSSRVYFAGNPANPAGLSTPAGYAPFGTTITPYDTGVRCTAFGGAVCPDSIVAGGSSGGGGTFLYSYGWGANWSTGKPVFPV